MKDLKLSTDKRKAQLQKEMISLLAVEQKELDELYLPAFRNKYEGTYWKCPNTYGGDRRNTWTMYIYFDKVTSVYDTCGNGVTATVSGYTMQVDCFGNVTMNNEKRMYVHSYTTPCDKSEFYTAYNKILSAFERLKG